MLNKYIKINSIQLTLQLCILQIIYKKLSFQEIFAVKSGKSIRSFSSESIRSKMLWTLILKLFLDIQLISCGRLFQIFTPYLEGLSLLV